MAGTLRFARPQTLNAQRKPISVSSSAEIFEGQLRKPWIGATYRRGATWRSGYATVCKTVYTSSILVVASSKIKNLATG